MPHVPLSCCFACLLDHVDACIWREGSSVCPAWCEGNYFMQVPGAKRVECIYVCCDKIIVGEAAELKAVTLVLHDLLSPGPTSHCCAEVEAWPCDSCACGMIGMRDTVVAQLRAASRFGRLLRSRQSSGGSLAGLVSVITSVWAGVLWDEL